MKAPADPRGRVVLRRLREKVRGWMERSQLTSEALARRAGLSAARLGEILERDDPTVDEIDALARGLGCRAADLLRPEEARGASGHGGDR